MTVSVTGEHNNGNSCRKTVNAFRSNKEEKEVRKKQRQQNKNEQS